MKITTIVPELSINGEEIITTVDHPFYVKGHGFVNAGALWLGAEVINTSGDVYQLENNFLELMEKTQKVYNFQVEGFHTYYISSLGIFVHNAKCGNDSFLDDEYSSRERMGRSRGNAPRSNKAQNEQYRYVAEKYNLTQAERYIFHCTIKKQGFGLEELVEIAKEMVRNRTK